MEKMKQFDEKLREFKDYDYNRVLYRFLTGIFVFIGSITFFAPLSEIEWKEDWQLPFLAVVFLSVGVMYYMVPYLQIGNLQNRMSIYELLRYMPIGRKTIRRNREKILFKVVAKITVLILCIQVIMTLLIERKLGICNVLYPLGMGCIIFLIGWVQVYAATRK